MDTEREKPANHDPQSDEVSQQSAAGEENAEPLITPEIEENPDLEDPRLYSPLVDSEQPDPRLPSDDEAADADDDGENGAEA